VNLLASIEIVLVILFALTLGAVCWLLWGLRQAVKDLNHSLERLETSVQMLGDGLTIMLYLAVRDRPELLEKSPDLEKKALEAAERLGRKLLPLGGNRQ